MAKLKLQSNASGTGVVTLTAPNTNTDRTITLPDVTGGILTSASTLDATKLSGALPILDGSSLTGVGPTKSASDPAIDTNGAVGDQWVNTTSGEMFVCTDASSGANTWTNIGAGSGNVEPIYAVDFLCVAGGGGGGSGGGGGAGGYRNSYSTETTGDSCVGENSLTFTMGTIYTINVGAGGSGGQSSWFGSNGQDSSISGTGLTTITSTGGGAGGADAGGGKNGGSGGGGGTLHSGSSSGGTGTSCQGTDGGDQNGGSNNHGAGGGGASQRGRHSNEGKHGGNGIASAITGSAITRAGGGGGSDRSGTGSPGNGGTGGGGNGNSNSGQTGSAGGANLGGGGGGGPGHPGYGNPTGGNGGSGVVILRMPTSKYTGTTTGSPNVTTDGSDTVLSFQGDGTYTA